MPYGLSSKNKKNGAYATFEGALGRVRQWATENKSPKVSRNRSARTLGRALAPRFVGPARNPLWKAHARTAISTRAIAQYHRGAITEGAQNGTISGRPTQMESVVSADTQVRASHTILSSGGARMHVEIRGASQTLTYHE